MNDKTPHGEKSWVYYCPFLSSINTPLVYVYNVNISSLLLKECRNSYIFYTVHGWHSCICIILLLHAEYLCYLSLYTQGDLSLIHSLFTLMEILYYYYILKAFCTYIYILIVFSVFIMVIIAPFPFPPQEKQEQERGILN